MTRIGVAVLGLSHAMAFLLACGAARAETKVEFGTEYSESAGASPHWYRVHLDETGVLAIRLAVVEGRLAWRFHTDKTTPAEDLGPGRAGRGIGIRTRLLDTTIHVRKRGTYFLGVAGDPDVPDQAPCPYTLRITFEPDLLSRGFDVEKALEGLGSLEAVGATVSIERAGGAASELWEGVLLGARAAAVLQLEDAGRTLWSNGDGVFALVEGAWKETWKLDAYAGFRGKVASPIDLAKPLGRMTAVADSGAKDPEGLEGCERVVYSSDRSADLAIDVSSALHELRRDPHWARAKETGRGVEHVLHVDRATLRVRRIESSGAVEFYCDADQCIGCESSESTNRVVWTFDYDRAERPDIPEGLAELLGHE